MVFDSRRGRSVLSCGFNFMQARLNDTWEYDGTTWQQRSPATIPARRHQHAAAFDAARQRGAHHAADKLGNQGVVLRLAERHHYLGARAVPGLVAELGEAGLQVQGERVVDLGLDLARGQERLEGIAAGSADDEVMVDVLGVILGQAQRQAGERLPVARGVVAALGKMKSAGRAGAEEFDMLTERGIPAWDLLSQKMGLSVGQLRKLSEQGKLKGAPVAEALIESFGEGKFAGLGEKLSKTALGRESEARDRLTQAAGEAGRDTFAAYKNALEVAISSANSPEAAKLGKSVNDIATSALNGLSPEMLTSGASVLTKGTDAAGALFDQKLGALKEFQNGNYLKGFQKLYPTNEVITLAKKFGLIGSDASDSFSKGIAIGKRHSGIVAKGKEYLARRMLV
jgi:tape measure domain-containing protein